MIKQCASGRKTRSGKEVGKVSDSGTDIPRYAFGQGLEAD